MWIILLILQILITVLIFWLLANVSKLLGRVNKLFEPGYVITIGKLEKVKEGDFVRTRGEIDKSYKIKGEPPPPPNGTPPPTG